MSATHPPDDSIAWKVWVGSIVSVVLATLFVGLRLLARRISAAPYWWDDYTIIAALVSTAQDDSPQARDLILRQVVQWGMGISRWIPLAAYYYGHHAIYVGPHRLEEFRKVCAANGRELRRMHCS